MEGVDYRNFDLVVGKLRSYFRDVKGFREVHTQNKKSISLLARIQKQLQHIIMKEKFGHFLKQDRCGLSIIC